MGKEFQGKKIQKAEKNRPMKWNKKSTPHLKKQCDLNAEVILPLQENHSPYDYSGN